MVKHSWGAGADRQVALLTESWWWRKRAGGGTLVMVDKVAASLTWTGAVSCPRRILVAILPYRILDPSGEIASRMDAGRRVLCDRR